MVHVSYTKVRTLCITYIYFNARIIVLRTLLKECINCNIVLNVVDLEDISTPNHIWQNIIHSPPRASGKSIDPVKQIEYRLGSL